MVKNTKGGSKQKKQGRKFVNAPSDKKVRYAVDENEIYVVVEKLLGNGMFMAIDALNKEYLCVMRNKFRGRNKRDNNVTLGSWVLIGKREWESTTKPKCDLLEVYNDYEKEKLKNSGNPLIKNLKSSHDTNNFDDNDDITFESNETSNYRNKILSNLDNNKSDEEEEDIEDIIDFDDI